MEATLLQHMLPEQPHLLAAVQSRHHLGCGAAARSCQPCGDCLLPS